MSGREIAALYFAVAFGSIVGALSRFFASEIVAGLAGGGFPWGTLFCNATGSFLIGLYAAVTNPGGCIDASPFQRNFVMTGLCGGYTTFSAFSLETLHLVQAGDLGAAAVNVALSLLVWLMAVAFGFVLGRQINRWVLAR